jgi:hypothetical protein
MLSLYFVNKSQKLDHKNHKIRNTFEMHAYNDSSFLPFLVSQRPQRSSSKFRDKLERGPSHWRERESPAGQVLDNLALEDLVHRVQGCK